jgi:hypothetical protein
LAPFRCVKREMLSSYAMTKVGLLVTAGLLATLLTLAACSAGSGSASPSVDAGASGNDARCPAAWSAVENAELCTTQDLLCIYPQGQAKCEHFDGQLRWFGMAEGPDCPAPAPPLDSPCTAPGRTCSYFSPGPGYLTLDRECCDGVTKRWEAPPTTECPNGNTCGIIHASDYDQTCSTANDCVGVADGDFCLPNSCACPTAFINAPFALVPSGDVVVNYAPDFAA